jgi:hypothetical protein
MEGWYICDACEGESEPVKIELTDVRGSYARMKAEAIADGWAIPDDDEQGQFCPACAPLQARPN